MDFELLPITAPIPTENGNLVITDELLSLLASKAFEKISFTFTQSHLEDLISIVKSPVSSENDRLVSSLLLKNALISAQGVFPLCQDTGIATIFAWKDEFIRPAGNPIKALSLGAAKTWKEKNLRFSTTLPDSLFQEHDPENNMPAQISLFSGNAQPVPQNDAAWRFLFCAKGGGSSNKTSLTQATKALLEPTAFDQFLVNQITALGTAACPPYSICVIVGGLSPEQNLLALKLATTGYFDNQLPGWDYSVFGVEPIRSPEWENHVLEIAQNTGLGAQFGGTALATSARVLRLPRHGASCPVSIGVSCSAHRNLHAKINKDGLWLERTVYNPASLPGLLEAAAFCERNNKTEFLIDIDEGIKKTLEVLAGLKPGTAVKLSGTLVVARDAAHARWRALLQAGKPLPTYTQLYPILYAGPAQTPKNKVTGSFGPTTAGRMDEYAQELMSRGAALVTIAKGNRSETWREACERWGATYLGTVGGAAALIADQYILSSEIIDYPDLGMEAVRKITVQNLPAFVLINNKGEDFYAQEKPYTLF